MIRDRDEDYQMVQMWTTNDVSLSLEAACVSLFCGLTNLDLLLQRDKLMMMKKYSRINCVNGCNK